MPFPNLARRATGRTVEDNYPLGHCESCGKVPLTTIEIIVDDPDPTAPLSFLRDGA